MGAWLAKGVVKRVIPCSRPPATSCRSAAGWRRSDPWRSRGRRNPRLGTDRVGCTLPSKRAKALQIGVLELMAQGLAATAHSEGWRDAPRAGLRAYRSPSRLQAIVNSLHSGEFCL